MKYYLEVTHMCGEQERLMVGPDGLKMVALSGDNFRIVDESGKIQSAEILPVEKDLMLQLADDRTIVLEQFYPDVQEDPITVSIQPEITEGSSYEFNDQMGNLPDASFSLMRFSNTEYINFEEQLGLLNNDLLHSGGVPKHNVAINDGPTAIDDLIQIRENESIRVDLLNNDFDPENDRVSLSLINGVQPVVGEPIALPDGAFVIPLADGGIEYLPNSEAVGLDSGESITDSFTYTIIDEQGNTSTAVATVLVVGQDDPTETNPDSVIVDEGQSVTIDVLGNDSDPDEDDVLSIRSVSQPTGGNVSFDGPNVTFDPGPDFDGLAVGETEIVTFTYTVETPDGTLSTETVTITVNGVNDGPDALDDAVEQFEDEPILIDLLANDSDVDGDLLSIIEINGVSADGSVDLTSGAQVAVAADGTVVYTPNTLTQELDAGESFVDVFTYTISDGNGGTDIATATVTILGQDDPTETNPDIGIVNEGETVSISVLANDSDPDSSDVLSVSSISQPSGGSVVTDGTNVTFDPGSDFEDLAVGETEIVSFTYTVSTPDGDTMVETVTVTINGANDDPGAIDNSAVLSEGESVSLDVLANDSDLDGDSLTVTEINGVPAGSSSGLPSGGQVSVASDGTVTYVPDPVTDGLDAGESFVDTFTYTISDGNGGTDIATATVTINGEDDPTVTNPDTGIVDEGETVSISVLSNDSDPDSSDTLSVSGVTQPSGGNVVTDGTNVTFDPGNDFEDLAVGETEIVTFTYTVTTPDGDTTVETVTVTVNGTNDGPEALNDSAFLPEGETVALDVLANDSDLDGDSLTVTEINGAPAGSNIALPSGGQVSVASDGTVTYVPDPATDGLDAGESFVDTFTYTISDGNGGTDIATATVTINGEDDPTVTNPDTGIVDEGETVSMSVLSNDSDPDSSDTLSVSSVTQPSGGNVVTDGTNVTFDPGSDFEDLAVGETEIVTFTYTVTTPDGDTTVETVTVTVNGTNDGPDALNDSAFLPEGETVSLDVLANDSDLDGDSLTVTEINGAPAGSNIALPSGGQVSVASDGTVTYVPDPATDGLDAGESFVDTFTYTISDGNGGTDIATATVTINGEDDPTVTNPDTGIVDEGETVSISVLSNDSDPDSSDTLSVSSVTQPSGGSVVTDGTNVTFDPGSDFEELAVGETEIVTFTYTVTTPDGDTTVETVTVTVNGTNDGPEALNDSVFLPEGETVALDVLANDSDLDGDSLTVTEINGAPAGSSIGLPSGGQVSVASDGTVTYVPDPATDGLDAGESFVDTFTYTISDGNGGTDIATATVTINGADDPTVTNPDTGIVDEGETVSISVLSNDSDPDSSDTLSVSSVTQPSGGNVVTDGTNVTFDPGSDFEELAVGETEIVTFTYTVTTPDGDTTVETVTVTVNGTNDGPDAVDNSAILSEGETASLTVLANDSDIDGDSLTVTEINGGPSGGSVSLPSGATVSVASNGSVSYIPDPATEALDAGETLVDSFTYTISDGNGGTDIATATITINGEDDLTITNPDTEITDERSAVSLSVLANDSDADSSDILSVSNLTQPPTGQGFATSTATSVTFTPGTDFIDLASGESELVTFTYDATTPDGDTVTETITITVNGVNDQPGATDDNVSANEHQPVTIDVLNNDSDPDASDSLTVTGITQPSRGTATFTGTDVSYDPGNDYNFLDAGESAIETFTYNISDGNGGTDTATVSITIVGEDDANVTNPDTAITLESETVTVSPLVNDSDPDASDNPLTVTNLQQPPAGQGSVSLVNSDIVFNPGTDFQDLGAGASEIVTFTYDSTTADGDATQETVTITVIGTNEAPQAADDTGVTDELVTVNIDPVSNDLDADIGDVLTITDIEGTQPVVGVPIALASGATVTLLPDGTVDYQPAASTNALDDGEQVFDSFSYIVQDQNGLTDTATVSVTVNGLDDPIIARNDGAVVDQGDTVSVDLLINDFDPDTTDAPLTVTQVNDPTEGLVVDNGDGTISFDPNGDFDDLALGESRAATFTYEVTNADGDAETATVTIMVNGINDDPIAMDDSGTTQEGVSITFDDRDNDSDPDFGDSINIIQINGSGVAPNAPITLVGGGTLTLLPSGGVDYQPHPSTLALDNGESATDTFTYVIQDQYGGTDTATATITILGEDDPLTSAADVASTDEDTPVTIDVLINDNDPDASDNPLSVVGVNQPPSGQGSVVNNGSDVTFNPGSDFQDLAIGESEIVNFTYVVANAAGETLIETVTVTVNGVNDNPEAFDDVEIVNEDGIVNIDLLASIDSPSNSADSDIDGDTVVVSDVAGNGPGGSFVLPSGALITVNSGGTVDYQTNGQFNGLDNGETFIDQFVYEISDGNGGTATATATVTVIGQDDNPIAVADSDSVNEGATIIVDVLANDSAPDNANDVNPTGTSDTDDSLAVIAVTSVVGGGTVALNGGDVVYDPGSDFESLGVGDSATVTFNYTVQTDEIGSTDIGTVTITVNGTNDGPVAVNDGPINTLEDTPVTISVLANDSDIDSALDPASVQLINPPAGSTLSPGGQMLTVPGEGVWTVDAVTGDISFTPEEDYEGDPTPVEYSVADVEGLTDTAVVTVTMTPVNDDPVFSNPDDYITDDDHSSLTLDVLVNDGDPDSVDSVSVQSVAPVPAGSGTISTDGNVVTFDPGTDFRYLDVGETEIVSTTYVVQSTDGSSVVEDITITITGSNDIFAELNEATSPSDGLAILDLLTNDDDPEGDGFSLSEIDGQSPPTAPQSVTVGSGASVIVAADGTVFYDPNGQFDYLNPGETVIDTFTYTVVDDRGATDIATVSVVVSGSEVDDTSAYQSATDDLYRFAFNPITGQFENQLIGDRTSADGTNDSVNDNYNSTAYNPVNDDVYGWDGNTLLRLDKTTGQVLESTVVNGVGSNYVGEIISGLDVNALANSSAFTAVLDAAGNPIPIDGSEGLYYVGRNRDTLDVVDIATGLRVGVFTAEGNVSGADVAYDNNSGLLWAASADNIISIDPITGDRTVYTDAIPQRLVGDVDFDGVTPITAANDDGNTWGGAFGDVNGNIGILNNDSGRIYWFNTNAATVDASGNPTIPVDFLAQGNPSGANDGAANNTGDNDLFRPHVFLDPNDSTGSNQTGVYLAYELGDPEVGITAPGAYVIDFNQDTLESVNVQLTNAQAGDQLLFDGTDVSAGSSGTFTLSDGVTIVSYVSTAGTANGEDFINLEVTGTATEAQYLEVIEAVGFAGANGGNVTPRFIEVVANDGFSDSSTSRATVFVQDAVPPVVIDLDGDGVEFDSIDDGINLDVNSDGELERTAWANEDDAVLIYDANNNNDVDGREEYAFADYSDDANATDLQGLAEAFDSNEDGVLSSDDEEFEEFKLWQDADGDGQVDDGELSTLEEAGIESIGLVSDGESYVTADGDVTVHGEAVVQYADGSTGIAADAEFNFEAFFQPDLIVNSESGEEINLDDTAGVDQPPAGNPNSELDDLPAAAAPSASDDEAAAAAEIPQ